MNNILYAACAAAVLLLAGTVYLMVRNRYEDDGYLCVRETPMTVLMALMAIAMGVWLVYLKLTDPTISGEGRDSYLFVAAFSLVCHLMGDYCLLFTFVKRVVVFDDHLENCTIFGQRREMKWTDVVRVEKPVTRKAFKLHDKDGNVITVAGTDKGYREFAEFAQDKLRSAQGKDMLRVVENRLRGK